MASAQSPVTRLANDVSAGPVSSKQYAEIINYFQQSHRAIVELTALVNRLPSNQRLKVGNHSFSTTDINAYSRVYVTQLGDLRKIHNNRKKRTNKGNNTQLQSLFYVSDQIVDLYKKSNLGPVDPEKPRGAQLSDEITLLTEKRMATSGILTSLITNYIEANDLRSKTTNKRFVPDEHMIDSLSDCVYTLNGKSLAKRKFRPDTTQEKKDDINDKISEGKLSAFDRVKDRVTKRVSKETGEHESFYDEKNGLLYTAMMIFNNYYRVPTCLLTDEEKESLSDEENVKASKVLQEKLSNITKHRKSRDVKA
jgi:hypothetical protein